MDDEQSKSTDKVSSPKSTLDLSVLQALDFGPDWGHEATETKSRRAPSGGRSSSQRKKPFRQGRAGGPRARDKIAKPTHPHEPEHLVSFVPEETPFTNLIREMKASCRAYPLFDIAKLILEKPERFVVIATPLEKSGEEASHYFVTKGDGLAFTAPEEAYRHLMDHRGESYFEVEELEAEAPQGSFTVVNKCGITGELLAPPNYHRYNELIREHHATHLPKVSFEKFQRQIETEQSEEIVTAWLDGMQTVRVYRLKDRSDDEPELFQTREALQRFLFGQRFPKLLKKVRKARFSGVCCSALPSGALRRDVEQALDEQRRYPLTTANMLRSRFLRMNFAVYKRGSKGISFVCAVKRKIRTPKTIFADTIEALLHFIDENPNVRKSEFIERYLGFTQKKRTEEQEKLVRQLALDFRWLVGEGYVTEFADGTLLLPPVSHPSKPSPKKSGKKKGLPAESPSGQEPESPRNEDASASKEEGSEKSPADEAS